jgi:hypothetical protein
MLPKEINGGTSQFNEKNSIISLAWIASTKFLPSLSPRPRVWNTERNGRAGSDGSLLDILVKFRIQVQFVVRTNCKLKIFCTIVTIISYI